MLQDKIPEGHYVLVDLEDLYQSYLNLDPKVRHCEPLAVADLSPSHAFEAELCGLFPMVGIKGMELDQCVSYADDIALSAYDIPAWNEETGKQEGTRTATPEEQDIIDKYAKAMEELGMELHEKIKHLDLHTPDEGVIELEFHSVIQNRFLLLAKPDPEELPLEPEN